MLCVSLCVVICLTVHLALGFFSGGILASSLMSSLHATDGLDTQAQQQQQQQQQSAAEKGQMAQLLAWGIAPAAVIYQRQYYRLLSNVFVHYGLSHLGMNLATLALVGAPVERLFGSLQMAFFVLWAALASSALYVGAFWCAFLWTGDASYLYREAVGISGVLFTLTVCEAHFCSRGRPTRRLYGLAVPTRWYPWLLLAALSVLIPNVSFLAHACGVAVGVLDVYGVLGLLVPSARFCAVLEGGGLGAAALWERVTALPGYVRAPVDAAATGGAPSAGALAGLLGEEQSRFVERQPCKLLLPHAWHALQTVLAQALALMRNGIGLVLGQPFVDAGGRRLGALRTWCSASFCCCCCCCCRRRRRRSGIFGGRGDAGDVTSPHTVQAAGARARADGQSALAAAPPPHSSAHSRPRASNVAGKSRLLQQLEQAQQSATAAQPQPADDT